MTIPSTEDTTQAVTAWAVEVLPELSGSYGYATDERYKGLPDVAIEVVDYTLGESAMTGVLAQLQQVQQVLLKVTTIELILVVQPDPPDAADQTLKDFADRLIAALLKDTTLGGRVTWAGNRPRVSFRPPFVEFDDGTRGRIVTVHMQIGEQAEA